MMEAQKLRGSPPCPAATTPEEGETVEVLFRGRWIRATFRGGDSIEPGSDLDDELWWHDHFVLDDTDKDVPFTLPEDTQSGATLPEWRGITKGDDA